MVNLARESKRCDIRFAEAALMAEEVQLKNDFAVAEGAMTEDEASPMNNRDFANTVTAAINKIFAACSAFIQKTNEHISQTFSKEDAVDLLALADDDVRVEVISPDNVVKFFAAYGAAIAKCKAALNEHGALCDKCRAALSACKEVADGLNRAIDGGERSDAIYGLSTVGTATLVNAFLKLTNDNPVMGVTSECVTETASDINTITISPSNAAKRCIKLVAEYGDYVRMNPADALELARYEANYEKIKAKYTAYIIAAAEEAMYKYNDVQSEDSFLRSYTLRHSDD